jgi:hypothetical protein
MEYNTDFDWSSIDARFKQKEANVTAEVFVWSTVDSKPWLASFFLSWNNTFVILWRAVIFHVIFKWVDK